MSCAIKTTVKTTQIEDNGFNKEAAQNLHLLGATAKARAPKKFLHTSFLWSTKPHR